MNERRRVFVFVPWISFEVILFGVFLMMIAAGLLNMLYFKLFGSGISIVAGVYLQYLAAIPVIMVTADQFAKFMLNPLSDPSQVPSSAQIQAFYSDSCRCLLPSQPTYIRIRSI